MKQYFHLKSNVVYNSSAINWLTKICLLAFRDGYQKKILVKWNTIQMTLSQKLSPYLQEY